MTGQAIDYKKEVLRELDDLSIEKITEVIEFIGYLKCKDVKGRGNDKIDALHGSDNALLSIVGIGESSAPHNLAKNHDKYAYGDL